MLSADSGGGQLGEQAPAGALGYAHRPAKLGPADTGLAGQHRKRRRFNVRP